MSGKNHRLVRTDRLLIPYAVGFFSQECEILVMTKVIQSNRKYLPNQNQFRGYQELQCNSRSDHSGRARVDRVALKTSFSKLISRCSFFAVALRSGLWNSCCALVSGAGLFRLAMIPYLHSGLTYAWSPDSRTVICPIKHKEERYD